MDPFFVPPPPVIYLAWLFLLASLFFLLPVLGPQGKPSFLRVFLLLGQLCYALASCMPPAFVFVLPSWFFFGVFPFSVFCFGCPKRPSELVRLPLVGHFSVFMELLISSLGCLFFDPPFRRPPLFFYLPAQGHQSLRFPDFKDFVAEQAG